MSEITVKVEKDGHANLDSFPYRYGFSGSKDFNLKLNYELKITQAGKGRINVKKAKFKNPETGNIEIGNFVLERNIVVTVIRHDIKTESTISKVIRVLREHKYIIVDDLMDTGETLKKVIENIYQTVSKDVYSVVLLDKLGRRNNIIQPDFSCFELYDDKWVVGYGMDYLGKFRGLEYIGYLEFI